MPLIAKRSCGGLSMTFPQGPIKLGLSLAYGYNELDPPSYLNTRSDYYLNFDGDSYATHTERTNVARIVMGVLPATDNTGLPDGAPTVTAGTYQVIDFTFTGSSITSPCQNGVDNFDGVVADIYYYDSLGELVDSWSVDEYGSDTQTNDADSSNNLTLNGISHSTDWYELQTSGDYDGKYLGYERWADPTLGSQWTDLGDGVYDYVGDGTFNRLYIGNAITAGDTYLFSLTADAINGTMKALTDATFLQFSAVGTYTDTLEAGSETLSVTRDYPGDVISATLSCISAREVLNP